MRKTIALLSLIAFGAGCSFIARDTETYKKDNRSLVETRTSDVKACYDAALANDPTLKGEVSISYTIEKKTGKLANMTLLTDKTTAPEGISACHLMSSKTKNSGSGPKNAVSPMPVATRYSWARWATERGSRS